MPESTRPNDCSNPGATESKPTTTPPTTEPSAAALSAVRQPRPRPRRCRIDAYSLSAAASAAVRFGTCVSSAIRSRKPCIEAWRQRGAWQGIGERCIECAKRQGVGTAAAALRHVALHGAGAPGFQRAFPQFDEIELVVGAWPERECVVVGVLVHAAWTSSGRASSIRRLRARNRRFLTVPSGMPSASATAS